MSQIVATFSRILKELLREKVVLFWTIAWPILWIVMFNIIFARDLPTDVLARMKGAYTISMCVFALMTAGMANLPGNIAGDRASGMLSKLKSMPLPQWKDFVGRILSFLAFSFIAVAVIVLIGMLVGSEFPGALENAPASLGFFLLVILAATGIGLTIGTLIRSQQGAIMTGVALTVVTAFVSGVFMPYSQLPSALQAFGRIYPLSASNSSIIYLLEGEQYAGYNPLEPTQLILTLSTSIMIFALGLALYSRYCWRRE